MNKSTEYTNISWVAGKTYTPTNYAAIATLHIEHAIKNRPYDNILFKKMINHMGDIQEKNIMEFGCGHGHYAIYLANCGAKHVHWVDIDRAAIENAKNQSSGNSTFEHIDTDRDTPLNIWTSLYDHAYSMYVYETIKDKSTNASIFNTIYDKLKTWWTFQCVIGNVKEFYGKQCAEFSFPVDPQYPVLSEWDPYTARLSIWNGTLDVQDFYHSIESITSLLAQAGFVSNRISVSYEKMQGNEYEGMIDETAEAPACIIRAVK